jgi:Holliday junction resolvasome RuvABC endonuclease subunit
MKIRKTGIISLDISSVSTGWSFFIKDTLKDYGRIIIKDGIDNGPRLAIFRGELSKVLKKYASQNVVIENGFAGRNIKTLKVLSNFSGVAQECVYSTLQVNPYIMNNKTVKSFFCCKNKKELYEAIIYLLNLNDFNFEEYNDITDSIAQAICYYRKVIKGG